MSLFAEVHGMPDEELCAELGVPEHHGDLNAAHLAEVKLLSTGELAKRFRVHLEEVLLNGELPLKHPLDGSEDWWAGRHDLQALLQMQHATARQRYIALLMTMKEAEEETK